MVSPALVSWIVAFPSIVAADTGFLDRSVTVTGDTYRYQVYVPLEWTEAQKWPVVLYLHANGRQGIDGSSHLAGGSAASLAAVLRADRTRLPAVVIFPQAAPATGFGDRRMQDMLFRQLAETLAEFNGDVDRVYLWGHAMGANSALRIASRFPEKFAAIVESAGRSTSIPNISSEALTEESALFPFVAAADPYSALARLINRVPIWIFHSASDEVSPVEQSRRLVASLRARNADVHYTEYAGLSHTETGAKVPTETELVRWLLVQRRSPEMK